MKKRTLNQTWILCLRMWRSISKKWNERKSIDRQKKLWLRENGFISVEIDTGCFFCDYDAEEQKGGGCEMCPGRLVDPNFDCDNESYDFKTRPVEFYRELLRLNRIRKATK